MSTELTWLLRLLAAHLITDFVLQPDSWVVSKREKRLRSGRFWYHSALAAFFAVLFTGFEGWWWIAPVIFISHCSIDLWKTYKKDAPLMFIIDQSLHLIVILIIWKIRFPQTIKAAETFSTLTSADSFWPVLLAIIFLTKPAGIAIAMLTRQFREKIDRFSEQTLQKAGTWIGILERLIIFFLVIIDQWGAIGFLIAAKSIIRLRDGDQKMSEYVLIGTLISISAAIITGYIISSIL
jgi:hypothetical protein